MADTRSFLEALAVRTEWVNELLLDPDFLSRVQPAHLQSLVRAYLERGGKRLRPAVLLFACGAVGGQERPVLPAATALELFHTWTLMHDDIIDHDDLRRGGPTGHVRGAQLGAEGFRMGPAEAADYGVSLSLLAGDVQHGLCVRLFLRCEGCAPDLLMRLVGELEYDVVCGLVEGEVLDVQMGKQATHEVSLEDALRMLYLKTGVLYEFAGKAGAMLGLNTGDAAHPQVEAVRRFCAECGLAFQLQDDVLGITGDEAKLGKPVGSDITEGKRTPVLLTAYARADEAQRAALDRTVGNAGATPAQIAATIALIRDLGAVDTVADMAREHVARGLESLRTLPESPYRNWLEGWAAFMVDREF
jgi:geranylgeranyl diphosphate synthase type I